MPDSTKPRPEPTLSLAERIAQLIMVRIGSNLPPVVTADEDEARIAKLLETCPVGGLLLFNGTKAATPQTLARLQAQSKYPLLVAADIERGVGQQVRGYTLFPHAAALARSSGGVGFFLEIVARETREAGIHITLAPVADVNTNPRNPIIAIRAFSEDAERAAQLTALYVSLAENSGLLTTAKHFPGHGDTHQDSHDSLPRVAKSLDDLRACELLPFQAAIDAGCSLVMTAHVAFPKIDPSDRPATLSRIILQDLLRTEMGFQGVVCSDSLLMAGVRDLFDDEGEMALATLTAGVDLLLDVKDPVAVVDYLMARVVDGSLTEDRVNEAFDRVCKLKSRVFDRAPITLPTPRGLPVEMSDEQAAELSADAAAREAVEITGGTGGVLPLDPDQPLVAVLLKPFETPLDPPEQPLAEALRSRFCDVRYTELGPRADAAAIESARQLALGVPQLLVAMIVRPAAWHAFGLLPQQRAFVRRLTMERPVVLASLGVPYALDDYPDASARICTYSDVPVSQRALVDVLLAPTPAR